MTEAQIDTRGASEVRAGVKGGKEIASQLVHGNFALVIRLLAPQDAQGVVSHEWQVQRRKVRVLVLLVASVITAQAILTAIFGGAVASRIDNELDCCGKYEGILNETVQQAKEADQECSGTELRAKFRNGDCCCEWSKLIMPLVFVSAVAGALLFGSFVYLVYLDKFNSGPCMRCGVACLGAIGFALVIIIVSIPLSILVRYFDREVGTAEGIESGSGIATWWTIWSWLLVLWGAFQFFKLCTQGYKPPEGTDGPGSPDPANDAGEEGKANHIVVLLAALRMLGIGVAMLFAAPKVRLRIDEEISDSWTLVLAPVFAAFGVGVLISLVSLIALGCPSGLEQYENRAFQRSLLHDARQEQDSEKAGRDPKKRLQQRHPPPFLRTRRCIWRTGLASLGVAANAAILGFCVSITRYQEYARYPRQTVITSGNTVASWVYLLSCTMCIAAVVLFILVLAPGVFKRCADIANANDVRSLVQDQDQSRPSGAGEQTSTSPAAVEMRKRTPSQAPAQSHVDAFTGDASGWGGTHSPHSGGTYSAMP
eukprot:TRINITY_DN12287_c0_g1_i1.p1 TRINITY_DN12287_c0_g1~~TRINITY_DN12287_c0_g1_i1.p1  ORF type:complete len:564 (+),score=124.23 TRINITY_DN12287_c0_g1_i1:78-1694(+)